jgi:serine/threonine protein kinase
MLQMENVNWIGEKLGASPYRLVRLLGAGGVGEAYLAEELHQGTKVVVKMPHAALLAGSPNFAARFVEEMQILKRLEHPNLVRIIDQSEFQGRPFVVMPYCEAGNLTIRMMTGPNGQLTAKPPENLSSWLPGVAQALDFLHGQGIVHRDVKPSNILFDGEGRVYLAETGLTRACFDPLRGHLTRLDGGSFGTPRYMAPEFLGKKVTDGKADQFALAMIVWEWLSGRCLFRGESAAEVMAVHNVVLSFLPPWLPAPWRDVFRKGLAKRPQDRFATCQDFVRELMARLDASPAAGDDGAGNFDLEIPAEEEPVIKTTVVETKVESLPTRVDLEAPGHARGRGAVHGQWSDLGSTIADAEKAHEEVSAWFLTLNSTNFPITFETRGKNWAGLWSEWVQHTVLANQVQSIFCQGTIAIQLRYNFRLAGGMEFDVSNICPQLWPAAAKPKIDKIDSRYQFVIQDGRIQLDFVHSPLPK